MSILHQDLLSSKNDLALAFQQNEPFRHVEIPKFFSDEFVERMIAQFPVPKPEEMLNEFGKPNKKYACHDVRSIGPTYVELDDYIRGQEFADVMSELTGIPDLLYDPEYHGAGTHDNMSGQGMDPHVDFNFHRTTGYHRRLNAIIYLNDEWKEEWGGCLQVHKNPWDPENDWTKTYLPLKNRCVLFETNEYSWHGFNRVQHPTDPYISRKSFTIYMYTKDRPVEEIGDKHGTIYVPRPLPETVQPNTELSQDDFDTVSQLISKSTSMVRGMYGREMKQNNVVRSLQAFRNNFQLPTEGFVRQQGNATGVHGNFGIMKSLAFQVRATRPCSNLTFGFNIPAYYDDQSVEILVDGEVEGMFQRSEGKITGTVPCQAKGGDVKSLEFRFKNSMSPHDAGTGPDKREFAAFLTRLMFD